MPRVPPPVPATPVSRWGHKDEACCALKHQRKEWRPVKKDYVVNLASTSTAVERAGEVVQEYMRLGADKGQSSSLVGDDEELTKVPGSNEVRAEMVGMDMLSGILVPGRDDIT
ncbi:hypothetical protein Dimus_011309 [Dionaea muscipula]